MNNREAQNEICRSSKTPREVYRIALSYELGEKYAKTYVSTTGGTTPSSTTGEAFQIKTEPEGAIRCRYRNSIQRGRGPSRGRLEFREGAQQGNKRCFKCDQPNFTPEHMKRCPARSATCNFCRKTIQCGKRTGERVATEDARQWG